jgi:hypothetical protein
MNVLWHWVPTLTGAAILAIIGFVLRAQIERDERKARRDRADKPTSGTAGA